MDHRIFRLLRRHDCYINPPSPFAGPHIWAQVAKNLWQAIRKPDMQKIWQADRGLYLKVVAAAKHCEDRSN